MWWKKYVEDTEKTTCWAFGPTSILFETSKAKLNVEPNAEVQIGFGRVIKICTDISIRNMVFHHMLTSVIEETDHKISIDSLWILLRLGEECYDESVRVEMMELICRIYATFPWAERLILGFSKLMLYPLATPQDNRVIHHFRVTMFELFSCLFVNNPVNEPLLWDIYDLTLHVEKVTLTTLQNLCHAVTARKKQGLIFRSLRHICLSLMKNESPFHMYCQPFDEDFPLFQELISSKMNQGRSMRILLDMMIGKNNSGFFSLKKFPVEIFRELKRFLL